jgi:hypothetical protein
VTSTFVNTIDVDPDEAYEVLEHRSDVARRPPSALGLDDHAIWSSGGALEHRLIWRFGGDRGHARIDWQIAVGGTAAAEPS